MSYYILSLILFLKWESFPWKKLSYNLIITVRQKNPFERLSLYCLLTNIKLVFNQMVKVTHLLKDLCSHY